VQYSLHQWLLQGNQSSLCKSHCRLLLPWLRMPCWFFCNLGLKNCWHGWGFKPATLDLSYQSWPRSHWWPPFHIIRWLIKASPGVKGFDWIPVSCQSHKLQLPMQFRIPWKYFYHEKLGSNKFWFGFWNQNYSKTENTQREIKKIFVLWMVLLNWYLVSNTSSLSH